MCLGVLLMPRPASARREEGAYRLYSTDEQRRQTGWISGQKCEVILDRTLRFDPAVNSCP
jgi:hypothetical protein